MNDREDGEIRDLGASEDGHAAVEPLTVQIPARSPAASLGSSSFAERPSDSAVTPPSSLIVPSPISTNKPRKRSDVQQRRRSSQLGSVTSSSPSSSLPSSSSSAGSFPTPFKCCGDFCDLIIQQLLTDSATEAPTSPKKPHFARYGNDHGVEASTALQLLFSNDERQIVGDHNLQQLLESVQVSPFDELHPLKAGAGSSAPNSSDVDDRSDLRILTYKSVALAKPNKHHLAAALQARQSGGRTKESTADEGSVPEKAGQNAKRRSTLMDPTMAHAIRDGYRTRIYGEMDGAANLYRQVRVCRNCYAIYTLLDRARELVASKQHGGSHSMVDKQITAKRAAVKHQWNAKVDETIAQREKLYLRSNGQPSSVAAATAETGETMQMSVSAPTLPIAVIPQGSVPSVLPVILSPKGDIANKDDSVMNQSGFSKNATVLPPCGPRLVYDCNEMVKTTTVPLKANDAVVSMDKYLRGESKQIEERTLQKGRLFHEREGFTGLKTAGGRRTPASRGRIVDKPVASVLLLDMDLTVLQFLHDTLTQATLPFALEMESLTDPHEALKAVKEVGFDLILVDRELQLTTNDATSHTKPSKTNPMSGLEFTKLVRQYEVQRSLSSSSAHKPLRTRTPIICLSTKTASSDLQLYKDAGMDGCIGKPINRESLTQTVQAALTKVLASATIYTTTTTAVSATSGSSNGAITAATDALAKAKQEQSERRKKRRRRLEAATTLPFPGLMDTDVRDYTHGTFQMDSETSFPFCVLGDKTIRRQHSATTPNTFFNLVVIHDLFDTWERLQILLNPIVTRYQGAVQILVWNYPGQAYTTWRAGTLLNNSYHCQCFQSLLQYVGPQGQGYLRDAPYYLLGLGNGGNIATQFASLSPPFDRNTRALLLVNSFSYVDAQLAQFFHDCLKVFACTPESRPDLPVYFHSRFLFSAAYLARVTTPLALNLYTAVMNPISLDGRKQLCQGALHHKDLRQAKLQLTVPFVSICASQNALVNVSSQTQTLVDTTGVLLVDSIGKVLRASIRNGNNGSKTLSSVVWLASGHEVLQECKQEMLLLLEQCVTGYHELHDAPHQSTISASVGFSPAASPPEKNKQSLPSPAPSPNLREEDEQELLTKSRKNKSNLKPSKPPTAAYEDTFIDRVLTTVNQIVPSPIPSSSSSSTPSPRGSGPANQLTSPEKAKWSAFQAQTMATATQAHKQEQRQEVARLKQPRAPKGSSSTSHHHHQSSMMTTWDPTTPAFERLSSNIVYKIGDGSKIYPDNTEMPEVKEYMAWRVQRNHKRLQRMDQKVRIIQHAFRAFFARTMAWRMKRERCAVQLQRTWRAKMARKKYKGLQKDDWAVRLVQRQWRGKMGRNTYKQRIQQYLAAREIQRITRGTLARRFVARVRQRMHGSASNIQRLVRKYLATRRMFKLRKRRNAAITLQRVFRGYLGRKRFQHEKDKFLFSKTQTQGITFGKQMLMEYKLYGTKLQSEVALLTSTKAQVEKDAELVVNEICEFEEGVRVLEMEMHALSQLETEGLSKQMDEQAKWQLREQKMRLDREFTQMLSQIATRKEKLNAMEEKLQLLDKERLAKEEELKGLERKLVILLDEQQRELDKIKQKQHTRSQLLLDILPSSAANGSGSSPSASPWPAAPSSVGSSASSAIHTAALNSTSAFSSQQREEANSLMESTETMMKFGFMSMSMTYFSSMNMVRAMRKIGAHHMTLDSAAVVSNKKWPEYTSSSDSGSVAPGGNFQPAVPAGSFPGQQPLQVAGWSVADVGRWLETLALGQYKRAYQDAAVDGALLLHLNDEDLKNTLGMEHKLHRKKVLTSVEQLREAERIKMKRLYGNHNPDEMPRGGSSIGSPLSPSRNTSAAPSPARSVAPTPGIDSTTTGTGGGSSSSSLAVATAGTKMLVSFPDFCTLVRHGKLKQIKEALSGTPERKFDPLSVATQYAPGVGTLYDDVLEKSAFHINKGDENGNTPLLLAAQNNNLKVVQYLISKGANPNHQNKHGQTGGHYAMAYSFFDLGAWLLDPEKGGGRDDILNENGLAAYDGL